jgi:hypothetical protein
MEIFPKDHSHSLNTTECTSAEEPSVLVDAASLSERLKDRSLDTRACAFQQLTLPENRALLFDVVECKPGIFFKEVTARGQEAVLKCLKEWANGTVCLGVAESGFLQSMILQYGPIAQERIRSEVVGILEIVSARFGASKLVPIVGKILSDCAGDSRAPPLRDTNTKPIPIGLMSKQAIGCMQVVISLLQKVGGESLSVRSVVPQIVKLITISSGGRAVREACYDFLIAVLKFCEGISIDSLKLPEPQAKELRARLDPSDARTPIDPLQDTMSTVASAGPLEGKNKSLLAAAEKSHKWKDRVTAWHQLRQSIEEIDEETFQAIFRALKHELNVPITVEVSALVQNISEANLKSEGQRKQILSAITLRLKDKNAPVKRAVSEALKTFVQKNLSIIDSRWIDHDLKQISQIAKLEVIQLLNPLLIHLSGFEVKLLQSVVVPLLAGAPEGQLRDSCVLLTKKIIAQAAVLSGVEECVRSLEEGLKSLSTPKKEILGKFLEIPLVDPHVKSKRSKSLPSVSISLNRILRESYSKVESKPVAKDSNVSVRSVAVDSNRPPRVSHVNPNRSLRESHESVSSIPGKPVGSVLRTSTSAATQSIVFKPNARELKQARKAEEVNEKWVPYIACTDRLGDKLSRQFRAVLNPGTGSERIRALMTGSQAEVIQAVHIWIVCVREKTEGWQESLDLLFKWIALTVSVHRDHCQVWKPMIELLTVVLDSVERDLTVRESSLIVPFLAEKMGNVVLRPKLAPIVEKIGEISPQYPLLLKQYVSKCHNSKTVAACKKLLNDLPAAPAMADPIVDRLNSAIADSNTDNITSVCKEITDILDRKSGGSISADSLVSVLADQLNLIIDSPNSDARENVMSLIHKIARMQTAWGKVTLETLRKLIFELLHVVSDRALREREPEVWANLNLSVVHVFANCDRGNAYSVLLSLSAQQQMQPLVLRCIDKVNRSLPSFLLEDVQKRLASLLWALQKHIHEVLKEGEESTVIEDQCFMASVSGICDCIGLVEVGEFIALHIASPQERLLWKKILKLYSATEKRRKSILD